MRLKSSAALLLSLPLTAGANLPAQTPLPVLSHSRIDASQLNQPHWTAPLITSSPRIEKGLSTEFTRQTASDHQTTWNYGNGKGLQVILFPRVELRVSPPPYITHSNPHTEDGFGDISFRLKYRLYGSNAAHHNAIVSAALGASVPTGTSNNGSCCAVLSPTLFLGKGFGPFAFTSTVGAALPVSGTNRLGRPIAWNSAFQLHAHGPLWIENEFNATFFHGGKNDGRQQLFATPGLILSRLPLGPRNRAPQLTVGVGEQIALTHFSTYNHAPIFVARLRF